MIAIGVCATKGYLYAWEQCIRRIVASAKDYPKITILFASDLSDDCKKAFLQIQELGRPDWDYVHLKMGVKEGERYQVDSQTTIAKMQGNLFATARQMGATQFLSVEADVLIPPDALKVLEWTLSMPQADGSPYYDVAMATYPNGLFLGGHGDHNRPILEDFLPEERNLTDDLKTRLEAIKSEEKAFREKKEQPPKEWHEKNKTLHDEIKKCSPIGNIWELNSKFGWRRRGWLDHAYPGIGRGAILPTGWVGLGCTLFSAKALALANFDGYDGKGTQDLFLCWKKWYPAGLRLAVVTHTICDHVKKEKEGEEIKYVHYEAYHEQEGESKGHLRVNRKPWLPL